MTDSRESAWPGYLAAVILMAPFFWLVQGDAYGRFWIAFDPGNSIISGYLQYYTRGVTGLVCLAVPLLLAYLLRRVVGNWMDTAWELSARAGIWLLAKGRRLAEISWPHLSRAACTLWKVVTGKLDGR